MFGNFEHKIVSAVAWIDLCRFKCVQPDSEAVAIFGKIIQRLVGKIDIKMSV
jgi:hypothetical protein